MNRYATQENFEVLKQTLGLDTKTQKMNESYAGITNGKKLMEVFPEIELRDNPKSEFITFTFDHVVGNAVERRWWNAPYKGGEFNDNNNI